MIGSLKNGRGRFDFHGFGFIFPAIAVLLILLIVSIFKSREWTHLFFNNLHHPILDTVMKLWTNLGDGLWTLIIILPFLFIRMRYFLLLSASYALSGLSAQIFKRLMFRGMPRPVKYFELNNIDFNLYIVPGYDPHSWHSFPSGHTATAFGLFFGLSLILKSKWLQFVCLILAFGVGYSRIYLSEHFLMDVTGGAILGICSAYLSFLFLSRYDNDWLAKPVHKLIIK